MMIYEFQIRGFHPQAIPVDQFIEQASIEVLDDYDSIFHDENLTLGPDGGELPNIFGWDD